MTSINRLPKEMLLEIYSHLKNCILKDLICVSKKWQELITPIIYEEVELQAFHIHKIKALFEKKLTNQNDYFNKLQWTKKLKIERDGASDLKSSLKYSARDKVEPKNQRMTHDMLAKRSKFEQEEFFSLLSYTPNLEEIDLGESNNNDVYMSFLRDVDSTKYLERIKRIYCESASKYYGKNPKSHFATYYNFRTTLTHVRINYARDGELLTLGDQTGDVLSFLPDFKCLTHLGYVDIDELRIVDDDVDIDETGVGAVTFYDLSTICPNLCSLEFKSDYDYDYDERLKTILAGFDEQKATWDIVNNKMEQLTLQLPNLSDKYIDLIIKYSPAQLKTLSITLDNVDLYGWMDQVGWDSALKLAQHMQLIPNVTLDFKANVKDRKTADESRMTRFFKLLGAVKGDRQNSYHHVHVAHCHPSSDATIRVIGDKEIDLYYALGDEDFSPVDASEFSLVNMEKSLIGPETINSWTFDFERNKYQTIFRAFQRVLVNCPYLQYLEFNYRFWNNIQFKIIFSTSQEVRSKDQVDKCNPFGTSQEYLKYVTFEGWLPTAYLDLFSSYLPDLERIDICVEQGYSLNHHDDGEDACDRGILTFDLTAFKKLKSFHMDYEAIATFGRPTRTLDSLFLHLKYSDGEDAYYSVQKKTPFYELTATTRQLISTSRLWTFEYAKKLEQFSLSYSGVEIVKLGLGGKF